MTAKLVWITPDAEKLIAYMARVSNPANQDNDNIEGLLKYCMRNGHWSIFEMSHMCVEIETTRDISAQMIRHRSFSFQEFSQRYAVATEIDDISPRRQDDKNRQNSFDDLPADVVNWFHEQAHDLFDKSKTIYNEAIAKGVAKECARKLLPLNTKTRLYMCGSIRSWIHYFDSRCDLATQLEHRQIADAIKEIFTHELKIIGALI